MIARLALAVLSLPAAAFAAGEHAITPKSTVVAYDRADNGATWKLTPRLKSILVKVGDHVVFKLRAKPLTISAKRKCKRYEGGFLGIGQKKITRDQLAVVPYDALGFKVVFVPKGGAPQPEFVVPLAGSTDQFVAAKPGQLLLMPVEITKLDDQVKGKVPGCTGDWSEEEAPKITVDETANAGNLTLTLDVCQAATGATNACPVKQ